MSESVYLECDSYSDDDEVITKQIPRNIEFQR